eukprot:CAMPEP_0172445098 /NCGR_PEP_ID=MMETSP1065-20121228/5052_1 /TAXON_ID=265537 /ORGANISM="Amphiprora paludosa, Strain CCMP125" /LENGTH=587 /DNA_ID=CAMNT_0013195893 /DNA_START=89 /DNA_END=1852 /DNA_ORIENTATION=-
MASTTADLPTHTIDDTPTKDVASEGDREGGDEELVKPPHLTIGGADEGPFHHIEITVEQVDHHLHHDQQCVSQDLDLELADERDDLPPPSHCPREDDGHYEPTPVSSWRDVSPFTAIRHALSLALTLFSIVMISAAIFTKQTVATGEKQVPTILAFIVFWGLLMWLAMMEAGLNCMVGLKPIDSTIYETTHTKTFACTKLAHRGDNLERFIVGRQYLDLSCVFLTSFMVSTIDDASVLGMPKIVNDIFLASGLAVILITIIFGQLVLVINAAHSMLDFMNNYVMIAITYVALAVEASGILHSVYLVQLFFSFVSGKAIESNEPPKTTGQKVLFWGRMAMSLAILVISFVVALGALFQNNTTMWSSVPPVVSVIILVALIGIGGVMEGLQIALFAVVHLPAEDIEKNSLAKHNCDLVFTEHGRLQAFLVGRQIVQTVIMFMIARITTVQMRDGEGNLFDVGDGMQAFFETGVLGALLSTIIASLSWRIIASSFPMAFLANPLSTFIIHFCLLIEGTGICYSSWLFAFMHQKVVGYERDDTYIATDSANSGAGKSSPGSPKTERSSASDHLDLQELSTAEGSGSDQAMD